MFEVRNWREMHSNGHLTGLFLLEASTACVRHKNVMQNIVNWLFYNSCWASPLVIIYYASLVYYTGLLFHHILPTSGVLWPMLTLQCAYNTYSEMLGHSMHNPTFDHWKNYRNTKSMQLSSTIILCCFYHKPFSKWSLTLVMLVVI